MRLEGVGELCRAECREALPTGPAAHKLRAMAQVLHALIDLYDYLALDQASDLRHEYVGGYVHAMTGGSMRHNRIAGNIYSALLPRLAGTNCQAFINDIKLHVQAAGSVYYPDVFIYCGSAVAGPQNMVTDATLIVEVLSESTAVIDRREKLAAYQKLPSLRSYWVVSQEEMRIEQHARGADGRWSLTLLTQAADALAAAGVPGAPLALRELYAGTDIG